MYVLYYLIIYPIELFLELFFSIIYQSCHDCGLAIIGVSLVINILLLPIYKQADKISEQEKNRLQIMKPYVDHIKKSFKGDERFMILQTYYRKQEYHPIYSLKSSIPLLLQIPFFVAAYHFLSNLSRLSGRYFLCFKDLGQPDGILVIPAIGLDIYPSMILFQGATINLLPILMTLINIISVLVYTKGSSIKEKIQLYVMALFFLFFLYKSPSGLVIYWTMNNLFSLAKNIVLKLIHSDPVLSEPKGLSSDNNLSFLPGSILLTILIGIVIPSSVIVSSPSEFVFATMYKNPLQYVLSSFLIASGVFLIWFPVFLVLLSRGTRHFASLLLWLFCGLSLVNYLGFGKIDSFVSDTFKYDIELVFSNARIIMNIAVMVVTISILLFIYKHKTNWIKPIYYTVIACLTTLSVINITQTQRKMSEDMQSIVGSAEAYQGFTLSKTGKNVIVIMLDRAIGPYVPYILNERPELIGQFAGFVYYPNTVSFGGDTIQASPALFGGYEYTPDALNKRPDEKLMDKHDEALLTMPVLFSENGFKTTVYDPPHAGYREISDLSIFSDYPDINAYSLSNKFIDPEAVEFIEKYTKRACFMYSIHKIAPVFLQSYIYDSGIYHYADVLKYPEEDTLDSLSILNNMKNLTNIQEADQNTFTIMVNNLTHAPCELQLPDYTISGNVNNRNLDPGYRMDAAGNTLVIDYNYHYHVNMAAFIQLGKWFDYLKENNVYDNTRIILVADHGNDLGQFENLILDDGLDLEHYLPLLMYKDFDSQEFSVCFDFMTNADTPSLATKGIIQDPRNPFSNKALDDHEKHSHDQLVLESDFGLNREAYVFPPGDPWYSVHDNAYDKNNWKRISP